MTEEDRIDLSSLDPARDVERWERVIDSIASRAWEARRRRRGVADQLLAWTRPTLALAAGVALAIWAGALLGGQHSGTVAATEEDAAFALAGWAGGGETPSTSRILQVLGDGHGK
jgi:hypothetical protein